MITRKDFLKGILASILGAQCLSISPASAKSYRWHDSFAWDVMKVVKIDAISGYKLIDNHTHFEIHADCSALDGMLNVYELGLYYHTQNNERMERILEDLKVGSIFLIKGIFSCLPEKEGGIIIYGNDGLDGPLYVPISEVSLSEDYIRIIRNSFFRSRE